ncbi:MAG: LLM class flavin-dependent oxidoreductase, partial [Aquihabitans sp.]
MQISMQLSYSGGFKEAADTVATLEKAGLDLVWVAEAYGFDGASLMGYLAAKTETVQIASGILPIYTRTPTLLAMTAAGVDALSDGRCQLGLGASGPQVIEGWHGVKYDAPIGRTREIIEICRTVWAR